MQDLTPGRSRWSRRRIIVVALLALLAIVAAVAVGLAVWALNPMAAESARVDEVRADPAVTLDTGGDPIELRPAGRRLGVGLVFYPGARVEPEAYVWKLSGLAADGVDVFVVRMPFNFAFFDTDAALGVFDDHPEIERWLVGGHSLGGAMACRFASLLPARLEGLVLLASYCDRDISGSSLTVVSLSGSNDGVTTPLDVAEHRDKLPPGAAMVEIAGANHASFGDYGSRGGDGPAEASDETVRDTIAEAVLAVVG